MESNTKISFSAITHIGTACDLNDDRIYANGRFMQTNDSSYSVISLEANESNFIFALSDGMDSEAAGISVTEDIKKLHEKMKSSSREILVKLDELAECVEQSNNLLYSLSLGDNAEKPVKPAFAGIIIDEGCIAAVNMGSCRIYKLDGNSFKLMVNDYKRTERLLKMGIINDEQAEMLSSQYKTTATEGRASTKKSEIYALREGTLYLVCSKGLTESVSEDTIYDLLASGEETDVIADRLLQEAMRNEADDNVTIMVLRIEKTSSDTFQATSPRSTHSRNISGKLSRLTRNVKKRRLDVARFATSLLVFVIIAGIIFGGFALWMKLGGGKAKGTLANGTGQTSSTASSTEATGSSQQKNTEGTLAPNSTEEVDNSDQAAAGDSNTSPTTPADSKGTYTVKAGDSLMRIAEKQYGSMSKYRLIMEANNMTDPNKISVGKVLKIPPAK